MNAKSYKMKTPLMRSLMRAPQMQEGG